MGAFFIPKGDHMNLHHQDETTKVIHGDCIETMNQMEPETVDAIVTDPPYGLGFMGKKWDDQIGRASCRERV